MFLSIPLNPLNLHILRTSFISQWLILPQPRRADLVAKILADIRGSTIMSPYNIYIQSMGFIAEQQLTSAIISPVLTNIIDRVNELCALVTIPTPKTCRLNGYSFHPTFNQWLPILTKYSKPLCVYWNMELSSFGGIFTHSKNQDSQVFILYPFYSVIVLPLTSTLIHHFFS